MSIILFFNRKIIGIHNKLNEKKSKNQSASVINK